jgi:hypothetical protein
MRGMDVNELETNLKQYHKSWKEAGHLGESGDISVRFPMYVAPSDEEAVEEPKNQSQNSALSYGPHVCSSFK